MRIKLAYLSAVLYAISCVVPAFKIAGNVWPGILCLAAGWYPLLFSGGNPVWLANVAYGFALCATFEHHYHRNGRWTALALSVTAGVLSLWSIKLYDNPRGTWGVEGTIVYLHTTLLYGCYVWMSSFAVLCAANLV
jgi:hypothetical protein